MKKVIVLSVFTLFLNLISIGHLHVILDYNKEVYKNGTVPKIDKYLIKSQSNK